MARLALDSQIHQRRRDLVLLNAPVAKQMLHPPLRRHLGHGRGAHIDALPLLRMRLLQLHELRLREPAAPPGFGQEAGAPVLVLDGEPAGDVHEAEAASLGQLGRQVRGEGVRGGQRVANMHVLAREGGADGPDAGFSTGQLAEEAGRVGVEVFVDDGVELGVRNLRGASREGDDGGDVGVYEAALQHGAADEARHACEHDFHVAKGVAERG